MCEGTILTFGGQQISKGKRRKINSDKNLNCSKCNKKAFKYIPIGTEKIINTRISIRICTTENGIYIH